LSARVSWARNTAVEKIGLYDINRTLARHVAEEYGHGKTTAKRLDARDTRRAQKEFTVYDAVISAVTFRYNPGLAKAALRAGAHFVDMGGNNDAVAEEFKLHRDAKAAGVVVIPDCGLAPGMVSIIAAADIAKFEEPRSLHIRVGGLPQKPRPPLDYQMVFSAEGLVNEMVEPVIAVRNGRKIRLDPMTEIETLTFAGIGTFEAFTTSGGISTLPETYGGILKNIDYKTIRYPGHCDKIRAMIGLGFANDQKIKVDELRVSPRAVFKAMLNRSLDFSEPDMVLVQVITEGKARGKNWRHVSEITDYYNRKSGLTAMMRCTAFPVAIVAAMAAGGEIKSAGVHPQESVIDPKMFEKELAARKIKMKRRWET
jgi:lysine 6-dehydrogenase